MNLISNVTNYLFNFSSCCLSCHQLNIKNRILCDFCWNVIAPYCGQHQQIIEHIRFHSYINWQAEKSDLISKLALSLKENQNHRQWYFLAYNILKHNPQINITNRTCFVPAPARKQKFKDHAFLLCQTLSEISHRPMQQLLIRDEQKDEQKTRSLSERKKIKHLLIENITNKNDVIFVDDVVTTGSTALAAYQALEKPENYQVISLIHRTR